MSQSKPRHPHRPACLWSRSTSKAGGVTPSAPCPPRYSNKEAANALAAAHDKMEYHRNRLVPFCAVTGDLTLRVLSPASGRTSEPLWTIGRHFHAQDDQPSPRPCLCELRVGGFLAPTGSPQCHSIPVCCARHWFAITPNCGNESCVHGQLDPAEKRQRRQPPRTAGCRWRWALPDPDL